jgi:hypothetical protein
LEFELHELLEIYTSLQLPHALQDAVAPPFVPAQVHVRGQFPLTDEAVPAEHKFVVGLVVVFVAALPHVPFSVLFALQDAVVPPFVPAQVHVRGQFPLTDEAVPTEHKFVVGLVVVFVAALPHVPFVGHACVLQL